MYRFTRKKTKYALLRFVAVTLIVNLILGLYSFVGPAFDDDMSVHAVTATDSLTVKIGYWGQSEDQFITKGTYSWQKLQSSLALHKVAYSFYRDGRSGRSYGTVIDSARGFYIDDLMDYCGISLRDISLIKFQTEDMDIGYFTSFTYSELFNTQRYYFEDLAAYLKPVYGNSKSKSQSADDEEPLDDEKVDKEDKEDQSGSDGGGSGSGSGGSGGSGGGSGGSGGGSGGTIVIGGDDKKIVDVELDSDAWNHRTAVKPMLALEDNWETFSLPNSGTKPNFTSMNAGVRFRLLFGQASPMEMRTNQTAKYTHTLLVMLEGVPKTTQGDIKIPNKVGSHRIKFDVSAEDEAFVKDLIDKLKWSSTDDTVLKITNVSMTKSGRYDDAITVTIDYTILKKGEASIKGAYTDDDGNVMVNVGGNIDATDAGNDYKYDGETGDKGEGDKGEGDKGEGNKSGDSEKKGDDTKKDKKGDYGLNKKKEASGKKAKKSKKSAADSVKVYELDQQIAELLAEKKNNMEYEDLKTPEEKKVTTGTMPLMAAGAVALAAEGALCSLISFRKRR